MAPRLRNWIGLAALSAAAVGVAAAQRPTTENDQPAQLDRSFGPDVDGGVGGAGGRDPGMSTGPAMGLDGGVAPGGGVSSGPAAFDGGAGVGGSGAAGGADAGAGGGGIGTVGGVDGGAGMGGSGRDGGIGGGGTSGSAQAGGHTNIIVYGPNGIAPERRSSD